jgi:SAM-dependent methyltransferase
MLRLKEYTNNRISITGKNILELGPGSDLGTGLYILSKGAAQYNACDVNNLINTTAICFYEAFFEKLSSIKCDIPLDILKDQLRKAQCGDVSKLNYTVREDFNLVKAFGTNCIDLVFSQAAFEHFDDIDSTIDQLSSVCKTGAVIVAEIDLKTHSRWIRDKDPNNIYRYHESLYRAFSFRGIPNRIRPQQYKDTFERFGWRDVSIVPLSTIDSIGLRQNIFAERFRNFESQMEILSIILLATKR